MCAFRAKRERKGFKYEGGIELILELLWKSNKNEIYKLGVLSYKKNKYLFKINREQLKKAIKKGCYGIGNFDLKKDEYISDNLFDFFENSLPDLEDEKKIMKKYNIKEYDKMKILEITKGKMYKDRYYLESRL